MKTNADSRVWLEIDLDILRKNFSNIQEAVKPCGVIAVLKANAYGLGVHQIAQALKKSGAAGFGVAELREALELVHLGLPVQILGSMIPSELPEAITHGIVLPVNDYAMAEMISKEAVRQNREVECHFLVDTGMGRLGIVAEEAFEVITRCVKLPNIHFRGIYSHFPVANRPDLDYTIRQVNLFRSIVEKLAAHGIHFDYIHIAASDAINNFPITYAPPFTRVRSGINLYGAFDPEGKRTMRLEPVLQLKTRLVSKRLLKAGTNIGYGCTYTLLEDTLVGTISAGYADGLPLNLSNRGYMLIRGRLCPVIGRVSMDYTTVSLSNVPDAEPGDVVTCIGGDGLRGISMEAMAQIKGTHAYDICCSIGSRVERRYIEK